MYDGLDPYVGRIHTHLNIAPSLEDLQCRFLSSKIPNSYVESITKTRATRVCAGFPVEIGFYCRRQHEVQNSAEAHICAQMGR